MRSLNFFFLLESHTCNLHPPHNIDTMEADTMEADTMEADTVYNATGDNDMDRDKACQVAPRQTDARAPAGAVQVSDNCTPILCAAANMSS